MKYLSILCIALLLSPFSARAQMMERSAMQERMDRLEHDIMLLQKQIARGEPVTVAEGAISGPIENSAQLEVRLTAIQDEMRQLRGKVEESEFQVKKLSENFEKLQRDNELRFSEMAAAGKSAAPAPAENNGIVTSEGGNNTPIQPAQPGMTTAGDGVLKMPDKSIDEQNFATPRDHYNYAFRLLNQTKYTEAASVFNSFTKKYPKDPLVGNAYYWEGETYYIRRDYISAADFFRQGFEALPNGPKAADNLLKLAMSLNALKRDKEACVVLQQINAKFKQTSISVNEKAMQEQKRIGCKG